MTGYANGTVVLHTKNGDFSVEIELKTINTRYFEALCKLPSSFSFLELKIVNLLQEKLIRGRTYLTVRFTEGNEAFDSITPSVKVVEGYIKAADLIKEKFGVTGDLSLADLMKLPNVFVQQKSELSDTEQNEFFTGLTALIEKLITTRAQEGQRLQVDLEGRFDLCAKRMAKIEKNFDAVVVEHKKRLDEQLKLAQNGDELAKKQSEELLISLNKMDIHEEITRFNSHLKSLKDLFADMPGFEKGKRLDFVMQELLREINTLMAKCPTFAVSTLSVDVKVELEKAREQVQNIV
jgi:uncharacterized protein (TIGR00255 family)